MNPLFESCAFTGSVDCSFVNDRRLGKGLEGRISDKLLANDSAVKFLAFGFDFSLEKYQEVVSQIGSYLSNLPASDVEGGKDSDDVDNAVRGLRTAIIESTADAISKSGAKIVRIGITGGMDSRLLYAATREVLPRERIQTFTLGYPGQYDYEYAKQYGHRFLSDHLFLDTAEVRWDINEEVRKLERKGSAGTYSGKSNLYKILRERGVSEYNVHGFMGDPLVGGTKIAGGAASSGWEGAVADFVKKNNRFKLQEYLCQFADVRKYLPGPPDEPVAGLDEYEMLDYGLRQYQRILGATKDRKETITPYTDERWMRAIISSGPVRAREAIYFKFLRNEFPDVFSELLEFNISNRKEHKKFRERVVREARRRIIESNMKNADGEAYYPQLLSDGGSAMPGLQFCERAEFSNNPTFRSFFQQAFNGLKERKLFSDDLLIAIASDFMAGSRVASEQMKGLVSLELNLRAGTISL